MVGKMPLRIVFSLVLILFVAFPDAEAVEPLAPENSKETDEPEIVPPDFIRLKEPMPDLILKDKREGNYWLGFPAIGYNPDTELTVGASVRWFRNGAKDGPFFNYTPYLESYRAVVTYSTGGAGKLLFEYEALNFHESPWRIRGTVDFSRNDFAHYFGNGESTLGPLRFPGSPEAFGNLDAYLDALDQVTNKETYARFINYKEQRSLLDLAIQRDTFGGLLRPFVGLQVAYYDIGDYTGENYEGGVIQPTKLRTDYEDGRVLGFNGGWDNALQIGLTWDTRDFEPNPTRGLFLQALGRFSLKAIGSRYNYAQFKLGGRFYQPLWFERTGLVLAGRLDYVAQAGDIPFYAMPNIPGIDTAAQGLGGFRTLRGYAQNRFVAKNAAIASTELRWTFGEATLWGQHLRFGTAAFVDSGSVFNSIGSTKAHGWKATYGAGFRLAWNVSTIVSFDYGVSPEGQAFYVELGTQF